MRLTLKIKFVVVTLMNSIPQKASHDRSNLVIVTAQAEGLLVCHGYAFTLSVLPVCPHRSKALHHDMFQTNDFTFTQAVIAE